MVFGGLLWRFCFWVVVCGRFVLGFVFGVECGDFVRSRRRGVFLCLLVCFGDCREFGGLVGVECRCSWVVCGSVVRRFVLIASFEGRDIFLRRSLDFNRAGRG